MSRNQKPLTGKEAASRAPVVTNFENADDFQIDPNLKAELDEAGLTYRWLNSTQLKANYGFDRRGWAPYKRKSQVTPGCEHFGHTDPEGFVRRGDMVLGARSEAMSQKKRAESDRRRAALNAASNQHSEEFKRSLKGVGKVYDGYEEND